MQPTLLLSYFKKFPQPSKPVGFPCGSVGKNLPANAGDVRDKGLIPGSGRSPEGGNGKLLPCLEILWTEEPGGLQSTGWQRARQD